MCFMGGIFGVGVDKAQAESGEARLTRTGRQQRERHGWKEERVRSRN